MVTIEVIGNPLKKDDVGTKTSVGMKNPSILSNYIPKRQRVGFRYFLNKVSISSSAATSTVVVMGDHITLIPDIQNMGGGSKFPVPLFDMESGKWLKPRPGDLFKGSFIKSNWWRVFLPEYSLYILFKYVKRRLFPKAKSLSSGDDSATYGWEGIKTTATTDTNIPIVYGMHKVGGNVIDTYVRTVDNKQHLFMLIALGEGLFQSIAGKTADEDGISGTTLGTNITINDTLISNLRDITCSVRLGADEQASVPGFYGEHRENSYTEEKLQSMVDHIHTTTGGVDTNAVRLTFQYPAIYRVKDGSYESQSVTIAIYYRLSGATPWTQFTNFPAGFLNGTYSACKINPSWKEVTIPFPAPGVYDVKVVKTSGNTTTRHFRDVFWEYMEELDYSSITYANRALLGLRILGTDQLSGGMPNVVTLVKGRKISAPKMLRSVSPYSEVSWEDSYYDADAGCYCLHTTGEHLTWDGTTFSTQFCANPVWCLKDLLTDERIGLGEFISVENLDDAAFIESAKYCDELTGTGGILPADIAARRRFRLDIVIDGSTKAPDLIQKICQTFRCYPHWYGNTIIPTIDKPEAPTTMFSRGNIIAGSYKESGLQTGAIDNCLEISYLDETDGYRQNTILVVDDASITAGDPMRKSSIFFTGITRQQQIVDLAAYSLKVMKYTLTQIAFKAAIDAVACLPDSGDGAAFGPGHVFNFAHDVPGFGLWSGRVVAGTTTSITVNQDVVLEEGKTYYAQVKHKTDVQELRVISSLPGTYVAGTPMDVSVAWDSPPENYEIFSIGLEETTVRPFRASKVTLSPEGEVAIEATEYNEEIFTSDGLTVTIPDYSNLPNPNALPQAVENLTASNLKADYDIAVLLEWTIPQIDNDYGWWDHADVYQSADPTSPRTFTQIGGTKEDGFKVSGLTPGKRYYFRVVSVSTVGKKSDLETAPEVSIATTMIDPPPRVRGLEIRSQGNATQFASKDLTLCWRGYSPAANDGILDDTNGAGFGPIPRTHHDYRVAVWAVVGGVPKCIRMEFTQECSYTYTYQMNLDDGGPYRHFSFVVRARDIFNQTSLKPACLYVQNPQVGKVTDPVATVRFQDITVTWTELTAQDLEGYEVRCATTPGTAWEGMTPFYRGKANACTFKPAVLAPTEQTLYIRVAAFDSYDRDDVLPSNEISATTKPISAAMVNSAEVVTAKGTITSWSTSGDYENQVVWNSVAGKMGIWIGGAWMYDGISVP